MPFLNLSTKPQTTIATEGFSPGPKLSFSFNNSVVSSVSNAATPAMSVGAPVNLTPRKLKDAVPTPKFSINLQQMTSRVGVAQLPRDTQKEAMRLTALVDTLNAKISSQQSALDAANTGVSALKHQISTEQVANEREIAHLRSELTISKESETDLRSKISTVLKTNEAIKLNKVAPLQTQVVTLEEQVSTLSIKLAEKPSVVESKVDTAKLVNLEQELTRVTVHRDALESDVAEMRIERNAAMEHVFSMTSAMQTGSYHYESEEEEEGEEDEEEENMVITGVETAEALGSSKCRCANPGKTHALSAIVHAGSSLGGKLPKRCPGHWPPLSQMHALPVASSSGDDTARSSAENNAHMTSLVRGVMNDLYSAAKRVQTQRMQQSGETDESIKSYFADIEKARKDRAAAAAKE